jgi:hypothetical protein
MAFSNIIGSLCECAWSQLHHNNKERSSYEALLSNLRQMRFIAHRRWLTRSTASLYRERNIWHRFWLVLYYCACSDNVLSHVFFGCLHFFICGCFLWRNKVLCILRKSNRQIWTLKLNRFFRNSLLLCFGNFLEHRLGTESKQQQNNSRRHT